MTATVATPPKVLLNEHTRAVHLEKCPTVNSRPERYTHLFPGWSSRDVSIAIGGHDLQPCRGCKPLARLAQWEQRHPAAAEAAALAEVVERHRFTVLDEKQLQDTLATLLQPARREVPLTMGGRVDLMVGRIAIEVKVAGSTTDLARQVLRYSHSPELAGILVITTRTEHENLPPVIGGKPVRVAIAKAL